MTLDKAIKHAEILAEEQRELSIRADGEISTDNVLSERVRKTNRELCSEYLQLAEWLKELKAYRETYPYGVDRFNGSEE